MQILTLNPTAEASGRAYNYLVVPSGMGQPPSAPWRMRPRHCISGESFHSLDMADDGLVLKGDALVGTEIARGSSGVVHQATLFGVRVCAKVGTA